MAEAQAQLARAQAELTDAQFNHERVKRLFAEGTSKEREVELAALAEKLADAQRQRAQAAVASAAAGYDGARAAVSLAKVNVNDTELRAPMHGRIASVPVEVGQMVQPGQAVMTIVDLRKVKLVIGVVERKLPLLVEGQHVKVVVPALLPRDRAMDDEQALAFARDGVIVTVPPAADPQAGVFNVEIELDNADDRLRPGMIGRAVVALGKRRAIAIPVAAATPQGNRIAVYFVREGYEASFDLGELGKATIDVPAPMAQRVVLEPIAMHDDVYLVADPPPGMNQLVIEGQNRLSDGQPVRVVGPATAGVD
jgi:RND family efflux transporter MFP subunit